MTELEKKLYEICKELELYSGYTEGVMCLVEDCEDDQKELIRFYEKHPRVNESDFLGYAVYINIERTEPERIIEKEDIRNY